MTVSQAKPISLDSIDTLKIPKSPQTVNYVDNEKLSEEMIKWRRAIDAAAAQGLERPPMPDYVGSSVMLIDENLATKPNYRDYSWISEMISDGIEACCLYLHNFNPEAKTRKGKPNAFGYISLIIERAFYHRIETEKRQDYYKGKSLELMGVDNFSKEVGEDGGPSSAQVIDDIIDRVYDYEKKQLEKAKNEAKRAEAKQRVKLSNSSTSSLLGFLGSELPEEEVV
jgi:hypothetical protein